VDGQEHDKNIGKDKDKDRDCDTTTIQEGKKKKRTRTLTYIGQEKKTMDAASCVIQ
jgi:hypothetical protein